MLREDFKIRQLTPQDLEQYNDLCRYAFQVTEKTLAESGWEDEDIKQSKFPVLERASVLGCFDGNNLVSQFAVYPLEMNVFSKIYSVGFVTSVATYPEYAGLGLMKKLMRESLIAMRERGQSLALLYPYSIPLYRKRGWEIVSDKISYRIRDTQLPKGIEAPGYVRRVSWDNDDFKQLHAQFARQTHGCLFRSSLAWDEYWRWEEDDTTAAVYYRKNGVPSGYVVYLIKDDIMYIKEMIYLDMEARKGLWKFIAAHESMVNEVKGNTYFGEPIAFTLYDSEIKEAIRPYIMGRIVDVQDFLSSYPFQKGEEDCEVTFHVRDDFLEWNNNSFTVRIRAGRGEIVEKEENGKGLSSYEIGLTVGTLTTLLLGYKRAPELFKLERIDASVEAIRRLDGLIVREKPYISDYI